MTEDQTLSGEHKIQYIDDILQNYTPEMHIILLTNAITINLIKIKKNILSVKNRVYAKVKIFYVLNFLSIFC